MTKTAMRRTATAVAATVILAMTRMSASAWPWSEPAPPPPPPPPPAYTNTALTFEQRVDDLVARMTLEEKASQLVNAARPIPRLGIPGYNWWSEALHGVANNGIATVFPQAIGLGASFDPALVHDMAVAISTEARVKFNRSGGPSADHVIFQGLTFWSPNINIFRDPRWGRGQETYGEDPWLSGQLGRAFVTGMQGDDPRYLRTIATPKHFAVHSGPETTRHRADVAVSKHDMVDTYLAQFRTAIVDGHAGSVMCAYNRINGQPACAQDFLLGETLRRDWGFGGYVVSDCDAIEDIAGGHHFTATLAEAAAVSLRHGVDNDCSTWAVNVRGHADYQRYVDAVRQGLVPESALDAAVKRLFLARMRLGLFDPPGMVPFNRIPDSELDSPEHDRLALRAARESMVLLKNNGVLPLHHTIRRIAVIGPLADQIAPLYGNYNGIASHPVSALEGIRRVFPNAEITFEPGVNFLHAAELIPAAVMKSVDGKPGLTAEFFDNEDFSGTPVLTRVDTSIAYVRDHVGTEMTVLPAVSPFAVRWTGTLTPSESGDYLIGIDSAHGRLWLDGRRIVHLDDAEATPRTVPVHLIAGHAYAVKIERGLDTRLSLRFVWVRQLPGLTARAVAAARRADVVIAVVGITPQLEGEEMRVDLPGFFGGDRTSLDLPRPEEDLIKAVRRATRKPLIAVLYNGSALAVNWASRHADAILEAWYGGQNAGLAIADILSGATNPSGRLPVTFYTSLRELPPFEDYAMANRTYRYYRGRPLYPFGFGLSYTSFAYSGLRLSAPRLQAGQTLNVDVEVKNTGRMAGEEVAQLYLTFPNTPGMPRLALRGVQRVSLQPGETRTVHFTLQPRDLSSVTELGEIKVQPGAYRLSVGGGQPGFTRAIASAPLAIEGEQVLPP